MSYSKKVQEARMSFTFDDFLLTVHTSYVILLSFLHYFLNMFYPTDFYYDNQYYKSIVQAYICIKDPKHKTLYKDIQNNVEKHHSYLNYEAFINFGYQILQEDYQLIKKITLARFVRFARQKLKKAMH